MNINENNSVHDNISNDSGSDNNGDNCTMGKQLDKQAGEGRRNK